MYCCPFVSSPRTLRRFEIFWVRLFSSTNVSVQIVLSSSSFSSTRPLLSTSASKVSKTFGARGIRSPLQRRSRCSGSRRKSPNLYNFFSPRDITAIRNSSEIPQKFIRVFQRQLWRACGKLSSDRRTDIVPESHRKERFHEVKKQEIDCGGCRDGGGLYRANSFAGHRSHAG